MAFPLLWLKKKHPHVVFRRIFIAMMFILYLSFPANANGKDHYRCGKHSIGFISGYGAQRMGFIDIGVDYTYQVTFLQLQYGYNAIQKKQWKLGLLLQPQFNITRYNRPDAAREKMNGFEFGLNIGGMLGYDILKDILLLYTVLSLGPHYISGAPERQTDGFIFSDNLFIGLQAKVGKHVCLDFRPGFRHISNASLKRPNGGVNTFIISGGVMIDLK